MWDFPHTSKQFSDTSWYPTIQLNPDTITWRECQVPQVKDSGLQDCFQSRCQSQVQAVFCTSDWLASNQMSPSDAHDPILVFSHSVVSDSVTPWTVAQWYFQYMVFSRQEYWNRLPFPTPENLSHPGTWVDTANISVSPTLAGECFTTMPPGKPWPPP